MSNKGEEIYTEVGNNEIFGMGWIPDHPDFRDFTVSQDEISPRLK